MNQAYLSEQQIKGSSPISKKQIFFFWNKAELAW